MKNKNTKKDWKIGVGMSIGLVVVFGLVVLFSRMMASAKFVSTSRPPVQAVAGAETQSLLTEKPLVTPPKSTAPVDTRTSTSGVTAAPSSPENFECKKTVIPYQKLSQNDPTRNVGETHTQAGYTGWHIDCPGGAGYAPWTDNVPAIDEITYVGTKVKPEEAPRTGTTVKPNPCSQYSGSAYEYCIIQLGTR